MDKHIQTCTVVPLHPQGMGSRAPVDTQILGSSIPYSPSVDTDDQLYTYMNVKFTYSVKIYIGSHMCCITDAYVI